MAIEAVKAPVSAAEFYVSSAAAALFGASKKARAGGLWCMLDVYFDESGTHNGSAVCVVAGLLASPARWDRLISSWTKVLASVGISDFHASDCVTGHGVFKGWKPEDREKLHSRLAKTIARTASYRIWTAVVMEDFYRYYKEDDKAEKKQYRICAFGCAARVKSVAVKRGPSFVVPYMFDQGPRGKWTYAAFGHLLDHGRGSYYYRMGALSKGDRLRMIPLQAADLHAYEVYRYFADQWKSRTHKARSEFWELLTVPDAGGYLMTRDNLHLLNKDLHRQAREGTNEPTIIPVSVINRDSGVALVRRT